jgi:hypothetical protein
MDASEIDSVLEGRSRRVVASSVYDLIRKRIAASHPADRPPLRAHDGRALRKRGITKTEGLEGSGGRETARRGPVAPG